MAPDVSGRFANIRTLFEYIRDVVTAAERRAAQALDIFRCIYPGSSVRQVELIVRAVAAGRVALAPDHGGSEARL